MKKLPQPKLTDAEELLIYDWLRTDKHFTFSIHQDGDHWHVVHEDHDSGHIEEGSGPTFEEAWNNMQPRVPLTPFNCFTHDNPP
jgi:hypothetical protein